MNFGRAKTILIFLFLLLNLFLIGYIFATSNDITVPDNKTVSTTTEILKSRNIYLSEKINLKSVEKINYLNLEAITKDEKAFASKLLDSFKAKGNNYTGDDGDVTITNGSFIWNVKDNHSFSEFDEKHVKKYAINFLKKHEFDTSVLRVTDVTLVKGSYKVEFSHYFFDKELFDIKTNVYISGGGVYKIEGNVFSLVSLSGSEQKSNPITVLLNYCASKKDDKKEEIIKINSGYYSENEPAHYKSLSAQPCFEIVLSDGNKLYFDAISSKPIKKGQN